MFGANSSLSQKQEMDDTAYATSLLCGDCGQFLCCGKSQMRYRYEKMRSVFISTTTSDYSLSHNAFDRVLNLSNCESLQRHILIHASSDSGDLPARSIIKSRAHFPLRIMYQSISSLTTTPPPGAKPPDKKRVQNPHSPGL